MPYNLLPYLNVFAGFDRPQPTARAAAFGGVLFNTGILFQSDLLTGYPTLDATGNDTYGFSTGVNLLGPNYDQQLIVEVAALGVRGSDIALSAPGDQAGVGMHYQGADNQRPLAAGSTPCTVGSTTHPISAVQGQSSDGSFKRCRDR